MYHGDSYGEEEFYTVFKALDLEKNLAYPKEFDHVLRGLMILAQNRRLLFKRPSNVGDIVWVYSLSCWLPFWPKSMKEIVATTALRAPLLKDVDQKEFGILVDSRTGVLICRANRDFLMYGRSILDLQVPDPFMRGLPRPYYRGPYTGRAASRAASYRDVIRYIDPVKLADHVMKYRQD